MTPEDLRIAKILKKKLSTITPLLDFRVFGSRARGDMEDMMTLCRITRLGATYLSGRDRAGL